MKVLITLVLVAAILTTPCITAFATNINQDTVEPKSGSTSVTMTVAPSYTVTIPEVVQLAEQNDGTYANDAVITATNIRLDNDNMIEVSISSDFMLINDQLENTVPYTLTINDGAISSGDTVAMFSTNEDLTLVQESDTLHFKADKPTFAGDYSDTVVFTIDVVDSE